MKLSHDFNNEYWITFLNQVSLTGLDVKERLARQQELLRKRLGMVPGLETGMDIMLDDEDILPAHVVVKKSLEKQKSKESQVLPETNFLFLGSM